MNTDCLIIGGGPAGLTAAIYLARFRLNATVVDAGSSRAGSIPSTFNYPGFPDGISGRDLLALMRRQATQFGAQVEEGFVSGIERVEGGFVADAGSTSFAARAVLLATGVSDIPPAMPPETHAEGVRRRLIRYCPVCDGFEASGLRIAVIGRDQKGAKEAEFLRAYTEQVTLITPEATHHLSAEQRGRLDALRIDLLGGPIGDFTLGADAIEFTTSVGRQSFDAIYCALGSHIHSDLANALGAACSDEGCIRVGSHQETSVPGLFAAGDVVLGLDQITHAVGEAGVAATAIRNSLMQAGGSAPLLAEARSNVAVAPTR